MTVDLAKKKNDEEKTDERINGGKCLCLHFIKKENNQNNKSVCK